MDLEFRGPNRHLNNPPTVLRTQIYQSNSDVHYVDQLACHSDGHYDPVMAFCKDSRFFANLFKNEYFYHFMVPGLDS